MGRAGILNTTADAPSYDEQQNWYVANGYQQERVDLRPMLDGQFLDYALARLGQY